MLKKYKDGDRMYVQGIRTWKELVRIVMNAKAAGYSYMGYDEIPKIGYAAVFKKQTKTASRKEDKK
ncbi:hypothetical protein O163_09995 [Caldanaerobacter subterraneus subsp. yonseiensis KB-1]|uniref:Uncharacterized protein n=1 Tax=Caldanaerobacter subterraneus subsp. yonseiensis KB-1 TaxID=1388761 RepID=U5CNC6_CALSX|nr:hypothetical protein [Caldanaerobacter subterraneus]ERM91498.1 hypothetical protein O163_09995 [Caldanaerobacter subterraneus subsp. yonseiensis KB-1]